MCQKADGKHVVQKGMCDGDPDVPGNHLTIQDRKQKCKVMKLLSKCQDPLNHPTNTQLHNPIPGKQETPKKVDCHNHVYLLTDSQTFPQIMCQTPCRVLSAKCWNTRILTRRQVSRALESRVTCAKNLALTLKKHPL